MSRARKTILIGLSLVILLTIALIGLFQWALRQVQPFYLAAAHANRHTLQTASRRLENRVSVLASSVGKSTQWEALFKDEEVNGWLAVTLEEKFPELLPGSLSDLRVAFTKDCIRVGFHYQDKHYNTIISLRVFPFVTEANLLAVRLEEAHAGVLPIPLEKVVQLSRVKSHASNFPIRWVRQANHPIALISIGHLISTKLQQRTLKTIELSLNELLMTGMSEPRILQPKKEPPSQADLPSENTPLVEPGQLSPERR